MFCLENYDMLWKFQRSLKTAPIVSSSFWSKTLIIVVKSSMRKKFPYSKLFLIVFSRIRTKYGESVFSPNAENTYQNNSEHGQFSRSSYQGKKLLINKVHIKALLLSPSFSSKYFLWEFKFPLMSPSLVALAEIFTEASSWI